MKLLFGFVIVSLALVAYGQRTTFEMSPMDWVAYSANVMFNIPVASKKDLLLYLDDSAEDTVMAIRRRDNTGQYRHVANFTELSSPFFTTNGKWIASTGEGTTLVSIDASNELSEVSYLMTYGGFLLSDDTFVGFDPVSETDDGNFTIRSFQYNSAIKNWTEIAGTGLIVTGGVQYTGDLSTYRATDTHLVFLDGTQPDNYTVHIYERQADKSWSLSDSVSVNSTYPGSVTYNGVDTLVYSMPVVQEDGVTGLFFLHTKVNGQWVQQKFNGANLSYKPLGIIGFTTIFLNADTLFVTAGAEGFAGGGPEQSLNGGKVLMMTRNAQGLWEPSIDLVGTRGLVGLGLAINDYDIIAPSLTGATNGIETTYFTAPICFTEPINVTCSNQQVNDCSDLSIAELYTINNPQCGAITATLKGLSLVNNQAVSAEFTFSRGYGEDFTCSARVTCPAPPVAPVSNNNNNVNGANVLSLGLASVLLSAAIMLL